jgi:hypothetical protein
LQAAQERTTAQAPEESLREAQQPASSGVPGSQGAHGQDADLAPTLAGAPSKAEAPAAVSDEKASEVSKGIESTSTFCMVASRHASDSISARLCSCVQEDAVCPPLAATAPPVLVRMPLHLCAAIQAAAPSVVGRGLNSAVGAIVETTAMLAAVAHFTFNLRS